MGHIRGAYSCAGFHFYWSGQFVAAELDFLIMQALYPGVAFTHFGLELLAKERNLWDDAERHLRAALRNGRMLN